MGYQLQQEVRSFDRAFFLLLDEWRILPLLRFLSDFLSFKQLHIEPEQRPYRIREQ